MATFNTNNYNLQKPDRTTSITRLATPNVNSSDVIFARIPYTLAGTESAADTINLGYVPAGAIPLPELSKVTCSGDPGTTLTLDVGTAQDADGWARGITMSSGGQVEATSGTMPAFMAETELTADTAAGSLPGNVKVYATVASAASLTASTILYFILAYKLPK